MKSWVYFLNIHKKLRNATTTPENQHEKKESVLQLETQHVTPPFVSLYDQGSLFQQPNQTGKRKKKKKM